MKRYIRTKDNQVYDLKGKGVSSWVYIDKEKAKEEYHVEEAFYCIYFYNEDTGTDLERDGLGGTSMDSIGESEILKQADYIEEICDGFLFKDTEANELHLDKVNTNDGIFILGATLFKETVRGYIETDKGLIYIAKLNGEGVFELL